MAQDLAESRAQVCATCPRNQPGNWKDWFTEAASRTIHAKLRLKHQMALKTAVDDRINVCSACLCPLKLKVWTPLELILEFMDKDTEQALDPNCWILKERNDGTK